MNPLRSTSIPFLCLAALCLVTYPGVLTGGVLLPTDWLYEAYYPWKTMAPSVVSANPRQNDAVVQLYPMDLYTRERLRDGEVPLWNPLLGAGIPHMATGFNRVFYPVYWPGLLLSPPAARNFEILAHLFLAGFFQYVFLRRLRCGETASLVGAMAFAWSGPLALRAPLNYVSDTIVWVPLVLFAVEGILQKRRGSVAFLACASGMQLLAGSLPDVMSSWILVSFYGLGRLVGAPPADGVRAIPKLAAGVALAAALASIQLVPQLELAGESHRGERSYEHLRDNGASATSLLTVLSPRIIGSDADRIERIVPGQRHTQLYFGIVGLVFCFIGLVRGPPRLCLALALAGAGTFLVSAGTPLLRLIYVSFPPIAGLRYVHTFANVCPVAFSAIGALGVHAFLTSETPGLSERSQRLLPVAVAGTLALAFLSYRMGPASPEGNVVLELATAGALLTAVAAVTFLRSTGRLSLSALAVWLVVISAADLVRFPAHLNPVTSVTRFPIFPDTKGLDRIRAHEGLHRSLAVVPRHAGPRGPWLASPNTLMAYGIPDASAYHSFLPARLGRYYSVMERQFEGARGEEALSGGRSFFNILESYAFSRNAMARLLSIGYVLFAPHERLLDHRGLREVYTGEIRVFRYVEQLPRAFIASEFEVFGDEQAVLRRLVSPDFDPARRVLLEQRPEGLESRPDTTDRARAEVVSYRPEHVTVEVESNRDALLVLSDTYYPGWRAYVDGEEIEILRANHLFRAVRIPRGSSLVEFRYVPRAYQIGKLLTLVAAIAIAALWRSRL